MEALVLGTSNCVMRDGFLKYFREHARCGVTTRSIGGVLSSTGLYYFGEVRDQHHDYAIIDYEINDHQAVNAGLTTTQRLEQNLCNLVTEIRLSGKKPILLILPSLAHLEKPSSVELMQEAFCQKMQVPYFNVTAIFRAAMLLGATKEKLMRDSAHMSQSAAVVIGQALSECITEMESVISIESSMTVMCHKTHRILASSLVKPERVIERGSSLRTAQFAQIFEGESLLIPIGENEVLSSIMINNGAKGCIASFNNGNRTVSRQLIMYWDTNNPDVYNSMHVDFFDELEGSKNGIIMKLEPIDYLVTERLLHGRPPLPGRYGELQIEGFLVRSQKETPTLAPYRQYPELPLSLEKFPSQKNIITNIIESLKNS
ncbi:hypothetical protein [Teichococcus aestuarii]|uniref:hypothetical protein n=1 Tax=Teichococcus aestuarii TaxID=568898 RepID=UPI0036063C9D